MSKEWVRHLWTVPLSQTLPGLGPEPRPASCTQGYFAPGPSGNTLSAHVMEESEKWGRGGVTFIKEISVPRCLDTPSLVL